MILKQVENFFPRLDYLLPEIKKIKLYNQADYNALLQKKDTWPGFRSKMLKDENLFFYELINTLLFKHKLLEKGGYEINSFLHLRLKEDEEKDWIHKDYPYNFASLIYLSETNFNSGTRLYDDDEKLINEIVSVKNRAVLYSGDYNHKGYGHYGTNVQDGRLTINIFIKNL
jgi:hypothetical protein|tara:strand:+ start:251 stop:763 length:513 start_codon:yes stop_codon:yes gene_type:complete